MNSCNAIVFRHLPRLDTSLYAAKILKSIIDFKEVS